MDFRCIVLLEQKSKWFRNHDILIDDILIYFDSLFTSIGANNRPVALR